MAVRQPRAQPLKRRRIEFLLKVGKQLSLLHLHMRSQPPTQLVKVLDADRLRRIAQAARRGAQVLVVREHPFRELSSSRVVRDHRAEHLLLEREVGELMPGEELDKPARGRRSAIGVGPRKLASDNERDVMIAGQWGQGRAALHLRKNT